MKYNEKTEIDLQSKINQLESENKELRELLKLGQSELYSIHSSHGDKSHAEEHSAFLTQAKQLLK